MDREKQKKLEKERMEKERAEMAHEEKHNDAVEEEGDGIRIPRKSKFVSVQYLCLGPLPLQRTSLHAYEIQIQKVGVSQTLLRPAGQVTF